MNVLHLRQRDNMNAKTVDEFYNGAMRIQKRDDQMYTQHWL